MGRSGGGELVAVAVPLGGLVLVSAMCFSRSARRSWRSVIVADEMLVGRPG